MPEPIAIESADDILQLDGQMDWSMGVNNGVPAQNLQPSEFNGGINTDIREKGFAKSRAGTTTYGATPIGTGPQAATHFKPAGIINRLCIISAGQLYVKDEGASVWSLIAGMTLTNTTTRVELRVYRNKLFIFSGNSADNNYSYDGATITDEGAPAVNTNAPTALITCAQQQRMFAAVGNIIYWSNSLTAVSGQWNQATQNTEAVSNRSDYITGMIPLGEDQILIGKKNSMWIFRVAGASNTWVLYPIAENNGCEAHLSMQQVGADVWWLSKDGVRSAVDVERYRVLNGGVPKSDAIQGYIDAIDFSTVSNAVAVVFDSRYLLAVTRTTGARDVLAYDIMRGAWAGRWENWDVRYWATGEILSKEKLYFVVSSTSQTYQALTGERDALTSEYPPIEILTKGFVHGSPVREKTSKGILNQYRQTFGTTITSLINDEGIPYQVSSVTTVSAVTWGAIVWPFTWGSNLLTKTFKPVPRKRALSWQIKIVHTGGPFALKMSALAAYIEPYRLE